MKLLLILSISILMQISTSTYFKDDVGILSIQLTSVEVEKGGKIYIAVFNKKEDFMTENRFKGLVLDANEIMKNDIIKFENLPYGDYVVSAYHDVNGNAQMDFDENWMPIESWAISGNVNPYAAPTWEDAKIDLQQVELKIKLEFQK